MGKFSTDGELTPFQCQFIDVWFTNNFNGKLSYKQLKPHISDDSAIVEASKILALPNALAYIELKKEEIRKKEEIKLSDIVNKLKDIINEVDTEGEERADGKLIMRKDRKSQLAAIQQLSKIAGFETKKIEQTITADVSVKKLFGFDEENDKAE